MGSSLAPGLVPIAGSIAGEGGRGHLTHYYAPLPTAPLDDV
jgi:hypothetical protein